MVAAPLSNFCSRVEDAVLCIIEEGYRHNRNIFDTLSRDRSRLRRHCSRKSFASFFIYAPPAFFGFGFVPIVIHFDVIGSAGFGLAAQTVFDVAKAARISDSTPSTAFRVNA